MMTETLAGLPTGTSAEILAETLVQELLQELLPEIQKGSPIRRKLQWKLTIATKSVRSTFLVLVTRLQPRNREQRPRSTNFPAGTRTSEEEYIEF